MRAIVDPGGALAMTPFSCDPDHYRRVRAALSAEIVRLAEVPAASG